MKILGTYGITVGRLHTNSGEKVLESMANILSVADEELREKILSAANERSTQPLSKLLTDVRTDELSFLAGKTEEDVLARSRGHMSSEDVLARGEKPDYHCAREFCIAFLNRVDAERLMREQSQKLMNFVATAPA